MLNPFSIIISKLLGKKEEEIPELNIDEYEDYAHIHLKQELESVRNEETVRDEPTGSRTKRRRQTVRVDS